MLITAQRDTIFVNNIKLQHCFSFYLHSVVRCHRGLNGVTLQDFQCFPYMRTIIWNTFPSEVLLSYSNMAKTDRYLKKISPFTLSLFSEDIWKSCHIKKKMLKCLLYVISMLIFFYSHKYILFLLHTGAKISITYNYQFFSLFRRYSSFLEIRLLLYAKSIKIGSFFKKNIVSNLLLNRLKISD